MSIKWMSLLEHRWKATPPGWHVEAKVVPHLFDILQRHDADVVLAEIDVQRVSRQDFRCQEDENSDQEKNKNRQQCATNHCP